jgi:putative zinc finger/helix-turn-helix YgiT family protein
MAMGKNMECAICGYDTVTVTEKYRYKESGLDTVIVEGVTIDKCKNGHEFVQLPGLDFVDEYISIKLLEKPSTLTGPEFRFLRQTLDLTINELSASLGVRRMTVSRWENGKVPVPKSIDQLIRLHVLRNLSTSIEIDVEKFFESLSSAAEENYQIVVPAKPTAIEVLTQPPFAMPARQPALHNYLDSKLKKEDTSVVAAANQELGLAA